MGRKDSPTIALSLVVGVCQSLMLHLDMLYFVHQNDVLIGEEMANLATERINVRSTADAKNVIEQAANLLGLSVSSFMLQSSFERAKDLLKSNHELKVNNADRDMLMNLLENPRPANDEMKKLMSLLDEN